jgi:hypothetical protein
VSDDKVVSLQAKLAERAQNESEAVERMDLKMRMASVAVKAVIEMLDMGATCEEIARSLQVVVDDLRSDEPGSFK